MANAVESAFDGRSQDASQHSKGSELRLCDMSDLCHELAGGADTQYSRIHGQMRLNRILERQGTFALLADISPLAVGHCLFVPLEHRANFGLVAHDQPDLLEETFIQVIERYLSIFGQATAIEHGSSSDMKSSACVMHAHIHLFPVAIEAVLSVMQADGIQSVQTEGWTEAVSAAAQDKAYYLVRSNNKVHFAITPELPLPRHYARIAGARALGANPVLADWAVPTNPEHLRETISHWRIK